MVAPNRYIHICITFGPCSEYNCLQRVNKHQQKTEVTRRKLLKAARRIFARDGFEAARIEDIAAEAGFTRGAFYANFSAKEDLFFALLDQQVTLHIERVRDLMEACSSEQERRDALRNYYATRAKDRQWSILVLEFKLFALRHSRLRAKLAEAHRRIKTKMKMEGIQRLLPSQVGASQRSRELRKIVLEALLNGLMLEQAYDPKAITDDEVAAILGKLFDTLARGLDLIP
jgi:AcrR family transcriptional regulator